MINLLASVILTNLTSQLPPSIRPIDLDLGPRTDINIPLDLPRVNGPITSAEIRFIYRPRSIWLVENQSPAPVMAGVRDTTFAWITWRPSNELLPEYRNRVGSSGLSLYSFWGFDLQATDGVLDFAGPSGTTQMHPGYLTVQSCILSSVERQRLIGTGNLRVYFHPTGRQTITSGNLPTSHWGQMRTEVEYANEHQLLLIVNTP